MDVRSERSVLSGGPPGRLRRAETRRATARLAVPGARDGVHLHLATAGDAGDAPCVTAAGGSGDESGEAGVIYRGRRAARVAASAVSPGGRRRPRGARLRRGGSASDPEQPGTRAMSDQKRATREEQDRRV